MPQLPANPSATTAASAVLAGLVEQVADHLAQGRCAEVDALLAGHPEHPEHAERLRQLLPAMGLLANAGQGEPIPAERPVAIDDGRSYAAAVSGILGDFHIVREVGRGGMGVVYEAQQISLSRKVALKVLPFAGMLDSRQLQRFTNEAKAAAGLHHQNIVPVYAVGNDRGIHFYAMQLIAGQTLAQVIATLRANRSVANHPTRARVPARVTITDGPTPNDMAAPCQPSESGTSNAESTTQSPQTEVRTLPAANLTTFDGGNSRDWCRTVARWGAQVADALEYAHSVGVVHRDIKPANLMLDCEGKVWVTDFGLAQMEADAGLTMTGGVVGTLRYMSPEQAAGEKRLVDQRSDIYSLGVTLYELLTLEPAFRVADYKSLFQQVVNDDPKRPRVLNPSLPLDMETIILKAMQKESLQRYATAAALSDDLLRFLADRQIAARRPGLVERCMRWCRRRARWVAAAAAAFVVLVVGLSVSAALLMNERTKTAYERVLREQQEQAAKLGEQTIEKNNYVISFALAAQFWARPDPAAARRHLAECLPGPGQEDLRGFEWRYLATMIGQIRPVFGRHEGQPYTAQFSPDGKLLATGGEDGVRVWDWDTGQPVCWLQDHHASVLTISFAAKRALMATAGYDGTVRLWDTRDWTQVRSLPLGAPAGALFSFDGQRMAVGTWERDLAADRLRSRITILDTTTWTPEWEIGEVYDVESAAMAPDSQSLILLFRDGRLSQYDLETQELIAQSVGPVAPHSVSIGPVSGTVAVGADRLALWAGGLRATASVHTPESGRAMFKSVAFLSERQLLTAGSSSITGLWELAGRPPSAKLLRIQSFAHDSGQWCIRPAPDRRSLVTTCRDKTIRRWDLNQPYGYKRRLDRPSKFNGLRFAPHGDWLLASGDGICRLDPTTGETLHQFASGRPIGPPIISPDGTKLAAGSIPAGELVLWNVEDGAVLGEWPCNVSEKPLFLVAEFMSDGRQLAFAWNHRRPQLIDVQGARLLSDDVPFDYNGVIFNMTRESHGRFLLVHGSAGTNVYGNDGKTFVCQREFVANFACFSRDGEYCLDGTSLGVVSVHRTSDWSLVNKFAIHTGTIVCMDVAPDNRTLAIGTDRGTVELWRLASGQPLMTLATDFHEVESLAFSPGGEILVAGGNTQGLGDLRIWRNDPDASRIVPPADSLEGGSPGAP